MHDDMTGMKSGRIVYWGILNYYDFLLEQVPVQCPLVVYYFAFHFRFPFVSRKF